MAHVVAPARLEPYWRALLEDLEQTTREAQRRRRYAMSNTPEGAIEYYYRSRARGSRLTLKQVAQMTGFSYDYIREKKAEYDRAGKWGSKTHKKTHN